MRSFIGRFCKTPNLNGRDSPSVWRLLGVLAVLLLVALMLGACQAAETATPTEAPPTEVQPTEPPRQRNHLRRNHRLLRKLQRRFRQSRPRCRINPCSRQPGKPVRTATPMVLAKDPTPIVPAATHPRTGIPSRSLALPLPA